MTTLHPVVRLPASLGEVRRLADALLVHPLLASVLAARGFDHERARSLDTQLEPVAIPTLDDAAERLETALRRGERILVHGDYDADGVTGTALLTLGIRALGGRVATYVPNRLTDGYGVSAARVEEHAARADLFVTVDCGISNHDEVAALRAAGVDVIVTDHHTPDETLPDALVVHPALAADDVRDEVQLTGAGIAYHLLWALHRRLGVDAPLAFADLAAIGTVADVAPLLGANRALVREGLTRLGASEWAGIRALVGLNKLRGTIEAQHVAFVLAPRVNAAGRLGRADDALELLTTGSDDRARVLATLLDAHNEERRRVQDTMLAQALDLAAADPDAPAVVLRHPDWHPGVMGIVASQVLEALGRPVFVVAAGKGSVRSTPGISAVGALRAARRHLLRFGGHTAAAGFALDEDRFDAFRDAINGYVAEHPAPRRSLVVDALLRPDQVSRDVFAAVKELEPYGEGHLAPCFAVHGPLARVRAVGRDGRHLQLHVGSVKGVAWNKGPEAIGFTVGQPTAALACLVESTFRDVTSIELHAQALVGLERLTLEQREPPSAPAGRLVVGAPPSGLGPDEALHLRRLDPDDLDPLAAIRDALADGRAVYLDLGVVALGDLEQAARRYPDVADVRAAFVATMRGRPLPWADPTASWARAALLELELLDERGRARAGQRRRPLESPTLRACLLARHAIDTVVNALRALRPEDAARCVLALLAETPEPTDDPAGDARAEASDGAGPVLAAVGST